MASLQVEIVTGERVVHQDEGVDMVVAPGAEGSLGILPRHAPLFSLLKSGELRIKKGGAKDSFVVFGGFIQVTRDKVVVMADPAEHVEEIHAGAALAGPDVLLEQALGVEDLSGPASEQHVVPPVRRGDPTAHPRRNGRGQQCDLSATGQ